MNIHTHTHTHTHTYSYLLMTSTSPSAVSSVHSQLPSAMLKLFTLHCQENTENGKISKTHCIMYTIANPDNIIILHLCEYIIIVSIIIKIYRRTHCRDHVYHSYRLTDIPYLTRQLRNIPATATCTAAWPPLSLPWLPLSLPVATIAVEVMSSV